MTAETLLRSLLDTRRQPTSITEGLGEPTRIRLLNELKKEPHNASELAGQLSVSRQTVYRTLPICVESGLVREENERYSLTCSGAHLLRFYRRFTWEEQVTILPRVARSGHRHWVLRTVSEQEARRTTLTAIAKEDQDSGPSRSTIYRILEEFIREGYLTNANGLYVVTEGGACFLKRYEQLLRTVKVLLRARAFLKWLPDEFDDFPVEALDEATIICNTREQPHLCLNTFIEIADPELETFHGIGTFVSPTLARAYRPVMSGGTEVRLTFTDDVLFNLHRNQEFLGFVTKQGYRSYIKRGLAARGAEFRFVPGDLPLQLAICNRERVVMTPAPSTGVNESETTGIDTTDPHIVQWALGYFERIYSQGRPPIQAFVDHRIGRQRSA